MPNIPLISYLDKNLTSYTQRTAEHTTFATLINQHFPLEQLNGHKNDCKMEQPALLKYHGSYAWTKIIATDGTCHSTLIHRFYCPNCRAT